jgi:tetratricopeptide (TPR) repeat protein
MSIGPNEAFPFDPDTNINPGEIVMKMLNGILENPKEVTDHDEMEAFKLLDRALETEDMEESVEFMLKALDHDPANVDVHLEFLEIACIDDQFQVPILELLEKIARQKLGESLFEEAKGHFWGMLETRPYMRVMECLATECHYQGDLKKAMLCWETMLNLNSNDNQGVREPLLLSYLALGKLKKADKIFAKYDEDGSSCAFSWAMVLRRIIDQNEDLAVQALKTARKQNKYMESFIKGTRKPPMELPSQYVIGSKEEAVSCVDAMTTAWNQYPEAIQWLKLQKK